MFAANQIMHTQYMGLRTRQDSVLFFASVFCLFAKFLFDANKNVAGALLCAFDMFSLTNVTAKGLESNTLYGCGLRGKG